MENERLHILWAKEEIRKKLYTYTRACDRNDIELGASVFTEDSVYDCGENFKGSGRAFFEWCIPTHQNYFAVTNHNLGNILIEVNGDTAVSESYIHAFNVYIPQIDPEGRSIVTDDRGRYLDEWKCVNGEWLIAKRRFIRDIHSQYPVADFQSTWGARDASDPSYELFN